MQKIPLVTITCARDLHLLELQAQSIQKHLPKDSSIYIVVNEEDPSTWQEHFDKYIKQYYTQHNLSIIYRSEFDIDWASWIPSPKLNWAMGWEQQQILKLAVSEKLNSVGYLILDSQNFLIWPWGPITKTDDQVPYRSGKFVMPLSTWDDYCKELGITEPYPTDDTLSICTPIFLHTGLAQSLIKSQGSLNNFSQWFKSIKGKSEFILYLLWAIKNGGLEKYHYRVLDSIDGWSGAYLRDSTTFDEDFKAFINFVGVHRPHTWVSINHRSWGDMTDKQYNDLLIKLSKYDLKPNFTEYRTHYLERYR
jgi:hypothetical protein